MPVANLSTDDLHLLGAALAASRDMVLVTDPDAGPPGPTIVLAAGDVKGITGYAPEELVGRSPRLLQGSRTQRAALDRIREAMGQGGSVREELVNYRRDGTEHSIELIIAPVFGADRSITHFVSLQRDMTERHAQRRAYLAAAEREREAIARDLHEAVGQSFAGISMSLASLSQQQRDTSSPVAGLLRNLELQVQQAIERSRSLARALAPMQMSRQDLPAALQALARSISAAYGLQIQVGQFVSSMPDLSAQDLNDLYGIAQEALLNAARHAASRHASVTLTSSRQHLALLIEDDGVGFDLSAVTLGLGIDSMRFRAAQVGASMAIDSVQGKGTSVHVLLGAIPDND